MGNDYSTTNHYHDHRTVYVNGRPITPPGRPSIEDYSASRRSIEPPPPGTLCQSSYYNDGTHAIHSYQAASPPNASAFIQQQQQQQHLGAYGTYATQSACIGSRPISMSVDWSDPPKPKQHDSPPVKPTPGSYALCDICEDNLRDNIALVPCGHSCFCELCIATLKSIGDNRCPICRHIFQSVQPYYN